MTPYTGRRITLALAAFVSTATTLIAGLMVAHGSVSRAHRDLLLEDAKMAAELLRATGDSATLRGVFGERWHVTEPSTETMSDAAIQESDQGLTAVATVYDADSWYETGTLHLIERADQSTRLPLHTLLLSVLGLLVLLLLCGSLVTLSSPLASRRVMCSLLTLAAIATPLATALVWSEHNLELSSNVRAEAAVRGLQLMPDLDSLFATPGGVAQLTGAQFVLRDAAGGAEFSALPSATTADLLIASIDGIERIDADRVEYLVADVDRVRLAVLPYDQTMSAVPKVALILTAGMIVVSLIAHLAGLIEQPRVFFRNAVAWSFLAPASVHLAVFTLGPLAIAAWLSLHRWSLIDVAKPFVGLSNYVRLLGDSAFWNAIKNTAVFALHVPASMAIALGLALIIQRRVRGMVALRAMLFLPTITSLVAVAMVWQWMLHDEYGLFNWLLSLVGLQPVSWLSSPSTALLSIMIMSTWMVVGYQMILFQAGLVAIPSELYDAARIDGAGAWRRFLHVTVPGLRHTMFFVLVTSIIGSFQVFGAVYVMTEGGPLHATDVAVFHIYQEAWEFLRFGDAAAMSWVLFAIIFAVTWLQFRTLERRVGEDA